MSADTKTAWRIQGEEFGSCNCDWGCPCQFNALPTHGRCEGFAVWKIREGHYGDLKLDGVRFAQIYWWPGPIHEGNGTRLLIVDEKATPEQRKILTTLSSGVEGGAFFEIFASVCPNAPEPLIKPIHFEMDIERRQAKVEIPGVVETHIEPIKNPVTGAEHRARIDLPNGFEYKVAEMGNAVSLRITAIKPLIFEHQNCYGQLTTIDWSN